MLQVSGASENELYREVKGQGGNLVKTLAAWWLVQGGGLKNKEVGKMLCMSEVAVSPAIDRVRQESKNNADVSISTWACVLKEKID